MSADFIIGTHVARRKLIRQVLTKVDRFSYDSSQGRLVLDKTGPIVFIDDVVKVMEDKDAGR